MKPTHMPTIAEPAAALAADVAEVRNYLGVYYADSADTPYYTHLTLFAEANVGNLLRCPVRDAVMKYVYSETSSTYNLPMYRGFVLTGCEITDGTTTVALAADATIEYLHGAYLLHVTADQDALDGEVMLSITAGSSNIMSLPTSVVSQAIRTEALRIESLRRGVPPVEGVETAADILAPYAHAG